jgi:hypothetical protein
MTVDASVVVVLTRKNEIIGAMGVMARRAVAVWDEVDDACGLRARERRAQRACAANRARIVLQSRNKLLISLARDRPGFAANLLFSIETS